MATGKLLRQLVKSGTEGNLEAFKRASEQLIQEERARKHHLLANDLERILYGRRNATGAANTFLSDRVPKDKERNIPLLQISEPVRRIEDVVLSDENASLLNELLQEHHRAEALHSYGLHPADRLLFCGPPGCGKTLTAEVLASELGLPLAIVRIDSVVSSLLGETASNLRQVFDFIAITPMVVLFDEFDALAKERADTAEHGELKRVVNAFLQMLDAYEGKSILVAATNHERILDTAIWRRFDEVLVFESPNLEQLRRLLSIKLRGLRREFDIDDARITSLFKGMSHADVERVLRRAAKDMVLTGKEFLSERHLQSAIRREDARRARMQGN
ncbi:MULTISPECIES: AAA family ATPase [Gammaproteobacteria]|jgi:SpoVK/Ycf46/Vps4 family AAA+-type ATPase|uniref:ATP-binding protein n=1 Tax=Pseudomonas jilinensis TaxID=2078689 RepID=A0A396S3S5_9PSED|nr:MULTISPECIES: AAA family ATPase [Gammaproteobacteria]KJD19193.1 ATPase AAA [Halomonas meridiana]RHW22322.1 ATP-binding protein [Pseudomonas jilinensis]